MAIDLPHERRCSCDHLAFEHQRPWPHACSAECCCVGFSEQVEVDLLEW